MCFTTTFLSLFLLVVKSVVFLDFDGCVVILVTLVALTT